MNIKTLWFEWGIWAQKKSRTAWDTGAFSTSMPYNHTKYWRSSFQTILVIAFLRAWTNKANTHKSSNLTAYLGNIRYILLNFSNYDEKKGEQKKCSSELYELDANKLYCQLATAIYIWHSTTQKLNPTNEIYGILMGIYEFRCMEDEWRKKTSVVSHILIIINCGFSLWEGNVPLFSNIQHFIHNFNSTNPPLTQEQPKWRKKVLSKCTINNGKSVLRTNFDQLSTVDCRFLFWCLCWHWAQQMFHPGYIIKRVASYSHHDRSRTFFIFEYCRLLCVWTESSRRLMTKYFFFLARLMWTKVYGAILS